MSTKIDCGANAAYEAGLMWDPVDRDVLREGELWDAQGVDLIGWDEETGFWWGTPRALWVLGRDARLAVRVTGWLGSDSWDGFFLARSVEDAIDYALDHGVREPRTVEVDYDDV